MSTGELIKEARKKRKLTQKELATKMGVVQSYISQYENDCLSPGLDTLERFAAALDCSVVDLLPIETLGPDSFKDLPETDAQTIAGRLKDLMEDFDQIIDHGGQESIYNALRDTVEFIEGQRPADPDRAQLLRLYERLNREGRRRALEYLEDLTGMDKYTE